MRNIAGYSILAGALLFSCQGLAAETLTYSEALQRTLDYSPKLKAFELGIGIKSSEELQVGLHHNPLFSIEYETGDKDERVEVTYSLSQVFELGGKHGAEKRFAATQTDAAKWDSEMERLDLILELTHVFIDTIAAQEKMKLAERQLQLEKQRLNCVKEQVQNGKLALLSEKKAEISYCRADIFFKKTQQNFQFSKQKLASLWGFSQPDFEWILYPFFEIFPLTPFPELECRLMDAPELGKSLVECEAAYAAVNLEKANRYPDIEVTAGVCTSKGFSCSSFFVELEMPLPLFDRNQGNVSRAKLQELQVFYLQEQLLLDAKNRLAAVYGEWLAAYHEASAFQLITSSSLKMATEGMREGYENGKFELLDVVEAEKSSLEVQENCIDAITIYHHKKAEILRLIGMPTNR
jgi:outer membrane protein, heavy metal efflux system